ncbi:hypothetical protein [Sphingorhabdus sp. Alg231-15]|uniref:hypothetical protein n=1 Tax=Sphingorhabdus sp. Alg231-15 TaxID=1922222 RepID=UPI000D551460
MNFGKIFDHQILPSIKVLAVQLQSEVRKFVSMYIELEIRSDESRYQVRSFGQPLGFTIFCPVDPCNQSEFNRFAAKTIADPAAVLLEYVYEKYSLKNFCIGLKVHNAEFGGRCSKPNCFVYDDSIQVVGAKMVA